MGGMGPIGEQQRYVVMVEIPGPKNAQDAQKVDELVEKLKQLGGTVKISITGSKGRSR